MARSLPAFLTVTCLALPLAAVAAGFDTGDEGWTASAGGAQTWMATGGNTGSWLRVTDVTDEDFLLNAPSAWLGNWSAFAGGTRWSNFVFTNVQAVIRFRSTLGTRNPNP